MLVIFHIISYCNKHDCAISVRDNIITTRADEFKITIKLIRVKRNLKGFNGVLKIRHPPLNLIKALRRRSVLFYIHFSVSPVKCACRAAGGD